MIKGDFTSRSNFTSNRFRGNRFRGYETYESINKLPTGKYTMHINESTGMVDCIPHDFVLDDHYYDRCKAREYESRRIFTERAEQIENIKAKASHIAEVIILAAAWAMIVYGACLPG